MIKMLSQNFFPDSSCTQRHMCVHARYIPGSRNSWCVPGPSFIQVKFCFRKRTAGTNFFVYSWIKGRIASIIIQVWQLLHKMQVLCLKILTPLTCAFSKFTPKIKPLRKLYPPLRCSKRSVPTHRENSVSDRLQGIEIMRNLKLRANGLNKSQQCCVPLHGAKILSGFKLCATTCNNIQQHATGCANGRNM